MHGTIAAGGISELFFLALAYVFKRYDKESGIPLPSYGWVSVSYILPCITWLSGASTTAVSMLFSYLAFSAFTDRHTKYLYTAVSRMYLLGGFFILAMEGHRYKCLLTVSAAIALYLLWVLACRLLYAINSGDVGLLATAAVWILAVVLPLLAEKGLASLFVLQSVPMAVYMIGSTLAFVCNITKITGKKEKRVAFAPYVLAATFIVLLWTCILIGRII